MPNPDDFLITRRTVYKFIDQPVPEEIITKAVTAAARGSMSQNTLTHGNSTCLVKKLN